MDQNTLMKLIQDKISFYQKQIEQVMDQNCSHFEKYRQSLSLLEEDITNITSISLEEIQEVIQSMSLSDDEKETELKQLKIAMDLLELNQTKSTTFQLTKEQMGCLERLKKQIQQLEESSKDQMSEQLEGVSEITNKVKKLKAFLGKLEDPKNKQYILEEDLLQELFTVLDEEEQEEVLYFVLGYNHSLYLEKMNQKELEERPRLNIEEVKEIFQNFDYDFYQLKEEDQDRLLTYGKIYKIPDIFECLERNELPRFDLKRNGKILVSLLINSDVETMEDILSYCTLKDISPRVLFTLIPAFIKQEKHPKGKGVVLGRSEDFKKNIEFLEEKGFSVSSVLRTCKELLILSHIKLVSNYQKFISYGFSLSEEESGFLCSQVFSAFLTPCFDEIADQFIEVHREGASYIQNHISRLSTILSSDDLLFYRLHMADQLHHNIDSVINIDNYQGITVDNKMKKTKSIEIECSSKDEFDRVIKKHRGKEEKLYNLTFNDEWIQSFDAYLDPEYPQRYDFHGVLISKQKVLRIYNILKNEHLDALEDSLFYAITYHSILSKEDVEIIQKVIKDGGK